MSENERPFLLQIRLMEMFGYSVTDRTNMLASMDHSYYYYFAYGSAPEKHTPLPPNILKSLQHNPASISLVNMSLTSVPLALYKHASEIVSMQLSWNPNISNIPVNFSRNLTLLASITLSKNHLSKFPSSLLLLKSLKELDLSHNIISNICDVEFAKINNLTSINLSNNLLKDMPPNLSKDCPNLEHVNFSNNFISIIPHHFLVNAKNLKHFDLSWNIVDGPIPRELLFASSLKTLNLSHNSISGCFPDAIASLRGLVRLDLSDNMIGGHDSLEAIVNINKAFSQCTKLEWVSLKCNIISPSIQRTPRQKHTSEQKKKSDFITINVNGIKYLSLSHQGMSENIRGLLIADISSSLTSLDLKYSKIESLPHNFFLSLPAVTKVDLTGNDLSFIPRFTPPRESSQNTKRSFGSLNLHPPKLRELHLSNNRLTSLPDDIGSLIYLTVLELQDNILNVLPNDIWKCSSLKLLNLTSNHLRKFTPGPYSRAHYSSTLRCSHCGRRCRVSAVNPGHCSNCNSPLIRADTNGSCQRELGSSLQYLYITNNLIDNDICNVLLRLKNLVVLHCAINEINDISYWFAKDHDGNPAGTPWYSKLRELHLGCNTISVLPCEIEAMKSLKWLFLNGNRLKTIPGELGKLKKLEVLDVASQFSSNLETTKLHYNVTNWPYEWNWNWNLDLKYLNLSGNKRLEIKEINKHPYHIYPSPARAMGTSGIVGSLLSNNKANSSSAAGRNVYAMVAAQATSASSNVRGKHDDDNRNLVNFNALVNLRFLGLIDVTCHSAPPDETHRRRIRATNSEIPLDSSCGPSIKYAIADVLGLQMNPENVRIGDLWLPQPPSSVDDQSGEADFEIWDLVIPKFRNRQGEALFAVFEGRGTARGTRAAKYVYDNFSEVFANELDNINTQSRKLSDVAVVNQTDTILSNKNSEFLIRIPNISLMQKKSSKDLTNPPNDQEKGCAAASYYFNEPRSEYTPPEVQGREEQNPSNRSKKYSIDKTANAKGRSPTMKTQCLECQTSEIVNQDVTSSYPENVEKLSKNNAKSNFSVRNAQHCAASQNCPHCSSHREDNDVNYTLGSQEIKMALHRTFLRMNMQIGMELGKTSSPKITCAEGAEIHAKQLSAKRQSSRAVPFQGRKMSSTSASPESASLPCDGEASNTASQNQPGDTNGGRSSLIADNNIHNIMFGVSALVLFFCSVESGNGTSRNYRLFTANVGDSAAIISRNGGRFEILSELHSPVTRLIDRKCDPALGSSANSEERTPTEVFAHTLSSKSLSSSSTIIADWVTSEIDRVKKSGGTFSDNCNIDGDLEITRSFGYYPLLGIVNSNPTINETIIGFDSASFQDSSTIISPTGDHTGSNESSLGISSKFRLSPNEDTMSNNGDEFIVISSSSIFKAFCRGGGKDIGAKRLASVARSAMTPQAPLRRAYPKRRKGFEDNTQETTGSYYNYPEKSIAPRSKDWSISAMKVRDIAIGLAGCDNARAGLVMVLGLKEISNNPCVRTGCLTRTPSLDSEHQMSQNIVYSDTYERLSGDKFASSAADSYLPVVSPPLGQVALVFTDIRNSTKMWEECPSGMRCAIRLHHAAMRNLILGTGGYEVKTEGDAFMISFSSVLSAVEWCTKAQEELLTLDWPNEIIYLAPNEGGLYYSNITDNYYTGEFIDIFESTYNTVKEDAEGHKHFCNEMEKIELEDAGCGVPTNMQLIRSIGNVKFNLLFRGLSVRMGVHWGSPLCEMDPVTSRMDYYGPMVNRAARVAGLAHGGQILMSSDSAKNVHSILGIGDADHPAVSNFHAPVARKGVNTTPIPSSLVPLLPSEEVITSGSADAEKLSRLNLQHRCIGLYKLRGLETHEVLFEVYNNFLKKRSAYLEDETKGNLRVISKSSINNPCNREQQEPSEDGKNVTSSDPFVILYWKMTDFLNRKNTNLQDIPTDQS